MTFCLDDSDVETWEIRAGHMRFRRLSDHRCEKHWDAARRKFHFEGKAVYEDDAARHFAEMRMCAEALGSWDKRDGRPRRLDWARGQVFMKLDDERVFAMAAVAEALGLTNKAAEVQACGQTVKASGSQERCAILIADARRLF